MTQIDVAILGATGAVGQRFVQLLADHPWFRLSVLCGSDRSAGKRYGDSCRWLLPTAMPERVSEMVVQPAEPGFDARLVFSALQASVAREIEPRFAAAGYAVCSNASSFRIEPDVPLLIPEVNPDHTTLIEPQRKSRGWRGFIVTNPNCTTTGITLALKPLFDAFGLRKVLAVSMQALSGAGYPGVASLDIQDNVLPFIDAEEDKMQTEPRIILGRATDGRKVPAEFAVSAQANRVAVIDGHTVCLSVELDRKAPLAEVQGALESYRAPEIVAGLPSAPALPVKLLHQPDRPQPRLDRDAGKGMTVSVGRVRPCPLLDYRLVAVVHNTVRGAAGGAVLNAELLAAQGWIG